MYAFHITLWKESDKSFLFMCLCTKPLSNSSPIVLSLWNNNNNDNSKGKPLCCFKSCIAYLLCGNVNIIWSVYSQAPQGDRP